MNETSIEFGEHRLNGLSMINVIMGQNGSGKSSILRAIDSSSHHDFGTKRYISPERAGTLQFEAGIITNIQSNSQWMAGTRRTNQVRNFKEQSFVQLSLLERRVLRAYVESKGKTPDFSPYLGAINALLDNVALVQPTGDQDRFIIQSKDTTPADREPTTLSSGEAELIALATETLFFSTETGPDKRGTLLLDEPDAHLHPDLQVRLMNLVINQAKEKGFRVIIATHSTAILSSISDLEDARICFMKNKQKVLDFVKIQDTHRVILPIFGAHPLTRVFNDATPLLVEGDDDVRIWQQAVRSSVGKIKLYPCSCGGKDYQPAHEEIAEQIIGSVYEGGKCLSLYDSDGKEEQLQDNGPVVRIRLTCRAAENLLLCDEVLESVGVNWEAVKTMVLGWLSATAASHHAFSEMRRFADEDFDRLAFDLKDIRNILIGLITSKPWEIVVGKAIADLHASGSSQFEKEGSLSAALGKKACKELLGIS